MRSLDSTRLVVDNDGWEHTDATDLTTLHVRVFPAGKEADPDYGLVGLEVPISPIDRLVAFANGLAVTHRP